MSTLVCIPVTRVKCRIIVAEGRDWTPVEELILWAISRRPCSIAELVTESNLPHQVVVTAIFRLNRFRFAEIAVSDASHKFVASAFGRDAVRSGERLPFFPNESESTAHFVIERIGGQMFAARDVLRVRDLDRLRKGAKSRWPVVLNVTGESLDLGSDAMVARVEQFVARGRERKLAAIQSGTARISQEHIGVYVENDIVRDLPEKARDTLRANILAAAAGHGGAHTFSVPFAATEAKEAAPAPISCEFSPDDIIVGGPAQRMLCEQMITDAESRVVLHSTFIHVDTFQSLMPAMRVACGRDVRIDILWGAAHDEKTTTRYEKVAKEIARLVREDSVLERRVRIGLQSTGSHAKIILTDTLDGDWIAAVSSCNWLKTGFRSVEITTLLRHPHLVARVARALQQMCSERPLADGLANVLAILARNLARKRGKDGPALVDVITGEAHDALMRHASGEARERFVVGMHKLGANAMPGALLPAGAAAEPSKEVKVLYTMNSGPVRKPNARELKNKWAAAGVDLIRVRGTPLHGKFLLWDNDNVLATSLNWGSAATAPEFPLGDIGVHVQAPGIADSVWGNLISMFPELQRQESALGCDKTVLGLKSSRSP